MTNSITQTHYELWQSWCYDHFPGEHVPVSDHHFIEEPFPNVKSELLLRWLHFISSCPITGYHRGDQYCPLCCSSRGSCKLQDHPSAFFKLNKTPRKSCPTDLHKWSFLKGTWKNLSWLTQCSWSYPMSGKLLENISSLSNTVSLWLQKTFCSF